MVHKDCRHYRGRLPCQYKRACDGCPHHDPIAERILIIKLGALGDLLRTTTVLPTLKACFPRSQITWVTQPDCVPLLETLPQVDRVWTTDAAIASRVLAEKFNLMICFDKDTPAPQLASLARATQKKGFGINERGALDALNPGSEYSLELGVDDDLKFRRNKKTYQQIIHEMADLPVHEARPPYQLRLLDADRRAADEWFASHFPQSSGPFIGMNPGAGRVFATKKWLPERQLELATRLHRELGAIPLLLGGPDEKDLLDSIGRALRREKIPFGRPGENFALREFAAIVGRCAALVTGDTLAMHLALAQGVRTVVLFTSTCPAEIDLYGIGRAIVGKAPCAPCYLSHCKQPAQWCAESITVDAVFKAVRELCPEIGAQVQGEKIRRRSHV